MTFPIVKKKNSKETSNAEDLNILNELNFKRLSYKAREVWVERLAIMLPPEYFPVSVCVAYVSLAR